MVYAREVVGTTTEEEEHKCTFGSWSTVTSPTCTTNGSKVRSCSCGATETGSIAALGHNMGSYYDNGSNHRRDCSRCSHYETEAHNTNTKKDIGDINQHELYCNAGTCKHYMGLANHSWTGGESSPHKCGGCGFDDLPASEQYHYYPVSGTAELSYTCLLPYAGGCGHSVSISAPITISGLAFAKYRASDSCKPMEPVPNFPSGTHTFSYSGKLRDAGGNLVSGLEAPEEWFKLNGWRRRSVVAHVTHGAYETMAEKTAADALKGRLDQTITINWANFVEDNTAGNWDDTTYMGGMDLAIAGMGEYDPAYEFTGNKDFVVEFYPGSGGWMFRGSPLFPSRDLFKVGSVAADPPVEIKANVYYCYRIEETGEVPWNKENGKNVETYEDMYYHDSVVVYYAGHRTETLKVKPDMGLIDRTGYRYIRSFNQCWFNR